MVVSVIMDGQMRSMSAVRSTSAVRIDRKRAAIATARSCGERLALASPVGSDLYRVLDELPAAALRKTEQRARSQLLAVSWRAAFSQGWRSATPGMCRD